MSGNLFQAFKKVSPDHPLQVGEVTAVDVDGDLATVTLPGGGVLQARGAATLGAQVFVRDGVIEGEAPALPLVVIEI